MSRYFIGLDLGQKRDYTALAILDRSEGCYEVRHLERIQLCTSYSAITDRVHQLAYMTMRDGPTTLVVDATGVGLPVFDELSSWGLHPVGITITGGRAVSRAHGLIRVPKSHLIKNMVALFQSQRLRIGTGLSGSAELVAELLGFQVRINARSRRESYQAGKRDLHDDLLLAVGMACFYGENEDEYTGTDRSESPQREVI
jgi:hypothetical protein